MGLTHNTLIISDLHLGEDLRFTPPEATTRHLAVLERQLVSFLRYHARRRMDGRPWRLIVNGDMVDFLAVCVLPGDHGLELDPDEITADEHVYGVGRRPRAARAKLEAVLERHEDVFRAFAQFLAAGNRLEVISGNHDTEFQFPIVQKAFREGLSRIWSETPESLRPGAASPEMIEKAIGFHDWFFYERGVVWVEHGHQYDECSSFENVLRPLAPESDRIAVNVDSASLRYMSNRMENAEVHSLQDWNMLGYLRYTAGLGARGIYITVTGYFKFVWALLKVWRARAGNRRLGFAHREIHRERLRELSADTELSGNTLTALDSLRKLPVVANLRRLLAVAFLDRLLIVIAAIVAALLAIVALPFLQSLVAVGVIGGCAYAAGRWAARSAKIDPDAALALMPDRILRHLDARCVVLGHTHEPVAVRVGAGAWYFNTGTWMPTDRPGFLRSFTHVVIRHGERGVEAHLRQWRDGASREFTPGWVPSRMAKSGLGRLDAEADATAARVA